MLVESAQRDDARSSSPKKSRLGNQDKARYSSQMTEKTLPPIAKAFSSASSISDGPIVLQVETEFGEPAQLKLSLAAAIQICALLLGDSRVEQAIDPNEKIIYPQSDA